MSGCVIINTNYVVESRLESGPAQGAGLEGLDLVLLIRDRGLLVLSRGVAEALELRVPQREDVGQFVFALPLLDADL